MSFHCTDEFSITPQQGQVGDCLIASANQRLTTLAVRYRQHSQLLADGVYVEEIPWISSTLATLSLVDTLVRNPPSP